METSDLGPKRLLACDGGGIRGIISLGILESVERVLQGALGLDDKFTLSQYFHYIAGTSTGAIIAAGLSLGWRVAELQDLYASRGAEMFDRVSLLQRFHQKYGDRALRDILRERFGADTTFGSERLQTLLMVVLRNATTDSAWPLSNNPRARFNQAEHRQNNLRIPLWQLVRASTAAPTFFPPEVVTLGESGDSRDYVFVDGGVTMFNNPAFQLFLMATHPAYNLNWRATEDDLLLVSVGTGSAANANAHLQPGEMNLLYNASAVPGALMYAASAQQDLLCRLVGRRRNGAPLDRELGAVDVGIVEPRLFSYVRYDVDLTRAGLDSLGLADVEAERVQRMDSIEHIADLQRVGLRAGLRSVSQDHFAGFLDR